MRRWPSSSDASRPDHRGQRSRRRNHPGRHARVHHVHRSGDRDIDRACCLRCSAPRCRAGVPAASRSGPCCRARGLADRSAALRQLRLQLGWTGLAVGQRVHCACHLPGPCGGCGRGATVRHSPALPLPSGTGGPRRRAAPRSVARRRCPRVNSVSDIRPPLSPPEGTRARGHCALQGQSLDYAGRRLVSSPTFARGSSRGIPGRVRPTGDPPADPEPDRSDYRIEAEAEAARRRNARSSARRCFRGRPGGRLVADLR